MTRLLRIDASARNAASASRALGDRIEAALGAAQVTRRDLNEPLPFVDEGWVAARLVPEPERSEADRASLAQSDALVAELQAADALLITTPVYNFTIPAALKAWIDLVARPGVTFRYTPEGPVGLLKGKRAIVAVASGGTKVGSKIDFATPYLRFVLGFVGITDVTFVDAASIEEFLAPEIGAAA